MKEKELKANAINAFLDVGKTIVIPVPAKNKLHALLQKLGIRKSQLTYTLKKIKVGNRERIAIRSENLPLDVYNGTYIVKRVMELSTSHTSDLIYCAAVALQNDLNEPSDELQYALRWIDDELLFNILDQSISNIDISNFLNSIVLIMGTESLMKTETQLNETSL